jgi:hypothetical protein
MTLLICFEYSLTVDVCVHLSHEGSQRNRISTPVSFTPRRIAGRRNHRHLSVARPCAAPATRQRVRIVGDSTITLNSALNIYDQWIRDPRVALASEPLEIDKRFRRALSPVSAQPATKAIADCYLFGFAAAAGAHIVTLDKGLAGMAKRQKVSVALIRPV